MKLLLPAGTDIYLTGGKTHASEIRLARFLLETVGEGDHFVDIGAHYGYFTLLAAELVGVQGSVTAFEAAPLTFSILTENVAGEPQVAVVNKAVSDRKEVVAFHEFSNLHSEYNTIDADQFSGEDWYRDNPPTVTPIDGIRLDDYFTAEHHKVPDLIKIDVEGAEFRVLRGATRLLTAHSPIVTMEYLSGIRGNEPHRAAETLLRSLKFNPYRIDEDGQLRSLENVAKYLEAEGLETDNIVFKKGE